MGQQPKTAMPRTTGDHSTELAALIARLERATWPDRELDAALFEETTGLSAYRMSVPYADNAEPRKQMLPVPPFTASIEAALTLVPEGMAWGLLGTGHAEAWVREATSSEGYQFERAATPAIALCIAALKARLATTTGERSPVAHDPSNGRSLSKNQAD